MPFRSAARRLALVSLATAWAGAAAAQAPARLESSAGPIRVETVARGLAHPWAIAPLPNGALLVTERPGRLRVVSAKGEASAPVRGTPQVFARGQGGLLDVALAPSFAQDRMIYLTYAEPGEGGRAGTALARARLSEDRTSLQDLRVVFRQEPKVDGAQHFGSRIVFARDGSIFVGLGERGKFDPSQDLRSHLGKVIRIRPDGAAPQDNPFIGKPDVRPEIWSYGHRNIQGAALHPRTGALWLNEMGPRGGDEINVAEAGRNYGWPLVSWGTHYDGSDIPDPPTRPDLAGSLHHWTPSIAPSGMVFYQGDLFPAWRDDVLLGALAGQALVRVKFDGLKKVEEERIPMRARIRDVRTTPDGAIWLLTDADDGRLLRLTPER